MNGLRYFEPGRNAIRSGGAVICCLVFGNTFSFFGRFSRETVIDADPSVNARGRVPRIITINNTSISGGISGIFGYPV